MAKRNDKAGIKAYKADWYRTNRERILADRAIYRAKNSDTIKKRNTAYTKANKQRIIEKVKMWQAENKDKVRAYKKKCKNQNREKYRAMNAAGAVRRQATKLQATPKWVNWFFIEEIYDLAARRTKLRSGGHRWHVDHIVPLRSKLVCGLHVHNNLQVIPGKANQEKSNVHWPDHPDYRFDTAKSLRLVRA